MCNKLTNFDEIWHGDVLRPSRLPEQIKFCNLKIQDSGHSLCVVQRGQNLLSTIDLFVSEERSNYFIVGLTDVSPAVTAPVLWNYDVCGRYPHITTHSGEILLPCVPLLPRRRFLIVQVEVANDALNFCEIYVFVHSQSSRLLIVRITYLTSCRLTSSILTSLNWLKAVWVHFTRSFSWQHCC